MAKDVKLSLVQAPDSSKDDSFSHVDIVCVHGLRDSSYRSWGASDPLNFWPRSLLPTDFPGARIFTYGYNARVAEFDAEFVSKQAEDLLGELVQRREPDSKVSN
jgi:hypothetical protein